MKKKIARNNRSTTKTLRSEILPVHHQMIDRVLLVDTPPCSLVTPVTRPYSHNGLQEHFSYSLRWIKFHINNSPFRYQDLTANSPF